MPPCSPDAGLPPDWGCALPELPPEDPCGGLPLLVWPPCSCCGNGFSVLLPPLGCSLDWLCPSDGLEGLEVLPPDDPLCCCSCSGNGLSWGCPWLPCSPDCEGCDEPGLPPDELGDDGDEGEDGGDEDGGAGIPDVWLSILQPVTTTRLAREPSIQNRVWVFIR